jgi:hypothetical protein
MTVNKDNNEDPNGKDNSKDNNNLIFDTTTNLWLDVGCIPGREGGVISTMMTTATTMAGRGVDSDEDNDKDTFDDGQRRPQLLT